MRRFTVLLLGLLFILSFSSLAAQEAPTPVSSTSGTTSLLEVVDSLPFVGEELQLDEPIQVFFNRPVNCDTAMASVSLTPAVAGAVTCSADDSSVTFQPSALLTRDTS